MVIVIIKIISLLDYSHYQIHHHQDHHYQQNQLRKDQQPSASDVVILIVFNVLLF